MDPGCPIWRSGASERGALPWGTTTQALVGSRCLRRGSKRTDAVRTGCSAASLDRPAASAPRPLARPPHPRSLGGDSWEGEETEAYAMYLAFSSMIHNDITPAKRARDMVGTPVGRAGACVAGSVGILHVWPAWQHLSGVFDDCWPAVRAAASKTLSEEPPPPGGNPSLLALLPRSSGSPARRSTTPRHGRPATLCRSARRPSPPSTAPRTTATASARLSTGSCGGSALASHPFATAGTLCT